MAAVETVEVQLVIEGRTFRAELKGASAILAQFREDADKAVGTLQSYSVRLASAAEATTKVAESTTEAAASVDPLFEGFGLLTKGAVSYDEAVKALVLRSGELADSQAVLNRLGIQTSEQLDLQLAALDDLLGAYQDDARVTAQLIKLRQRLVGANEAAAASADDLRENIQGAAINANRSTQIIFQAGQALEDFAFAGVRGAANNISFIVREFALLQKEGQTAGSFFQSLKGQLTGPQGLLLGLAVVSAGFAFFREEIGQLTEGLGRFIGRMLGINTTLKEFKKDAREAAAEAIQLRRDLDVREAVEGYRDIQSAIEDLTDQENISRVERFFGAFTGITAFVPGAGFTLGLAETFRRENEQVAEEIRNLELLLGPFRETAKQFEAESQVLRLGDPRVVLAQQRELEDAIRQGGVDLLELRRRQGQQSVQLENEIARAEADARIESLQLERGRLLGQFEALLETETNLLKAQAEAQSDVARQAAIDAVNNFTAFQNLLIARANQLQAIIDAVRTRTTEDAARRGADAARQAARQVEDVQRETERTRLSIAEDGLEKRLNLTEFEVRAQQTALRRQLEDFNRTFGARGDLSAAISAQVALLERLLLTQQGRVREEELRAERDHAEALLRIDEELALARGAEAERTLENRVQRARVAAQIVEGQAELERSALEKLRQAELELEQFRQSVFQEEQQRRVQRLLEERRLAQDIAALQGEIQAVSARPADALAGLRFEAAQLEAQATALQRRLESARTAAEELDALREAIRQKQTAISLTDPQDEERLAALRGELAALEAQLILTGDAASEESSLVVQYLQTLLGLAQSQRQILDETEQQVRRFTDSIIDSFVEAATLRRELSGEDIQLQRDEFRQQEQELQASLRRREISQEEFSLRMRKITQDRADFERRVQADSVTFAEAALGRLSGVVADAALDVIKKEIAKAIAGQIGQIGISIPFPASIVAAGAVFAAFNLFKSRLLGEGGFAEGGYTGPGPKRRPAGVVHAGEFVFPQEYALRYAGQWQALLDAFRARRLTPQDLFRALGIAGGTVTQKDALRAAGLPGYQAGGLVSQVSLLTAAPSPSDDRVVKELRAVQTELRLLQEQQARFEETLRREPLVAVAASSPAQERRARRRADDYDRSVVPK